jgi:hypothetical protein
MLILLDEDVPEPVINVLRYLLRGHKVSHVHEIKWSGKSDIFLYRDARARGYSIVVTNDGHQMTDPDECSAVRKSGVHRVSYDQRSGLKGLAVALASMVAAMPDIVNELDNAGGQRLVHIISIDANRKRYTIIDPKRTPPKYWS